MGSDGTKRRSRRGRWLGALAVAVAGITMATGVADAVSAKAESAETAARSVRDGTWVSAKGIRW